jgi:hypothetical protein
MFSVTKIVIVYIVTLFPRFASSSYKTLPTLEPEFIQYFGGEVHKYLQRVDNE